MEVRATTTIQNKYGFHVRPSTRFFELASTFSCDVHLAANGVEVDGKSVMMMMTLGAVHGTEITIICKGDDAETACAALVELVDSRFNGIE